MHHHTSRCAGAHIARHKSRLLSGISVFLLSLLATSQAYSQVAVRLKMNKSSYILNEPVSATVYITNHAGRQLVLQGKGHTPWLNFNLSMQGRSTPVTRKINYSALVIPAGQTLTRTVSLSSSYSLGTMGNYTCSASVNMPGPTRNGFSSNRVHFTVTNGRPVWVQRAGIPNAPGEIREYRLLTFSGNRYMELYAQVLSANTGRNIRTLPLGKILSFRKPKGTLDGANNMHALYQVKPNLFTHVCISAKGEILTSEQFKRGSTGDPRFMTFGDGEVKVAGGIPFSAEIDAAERKKIHSVNDRPAGVYNR
jgi:hypothetical protein